MYHLSIRSGAAILSGEGALPARACYWGDWGCKDVCRLIVEPGITAIGERCFYGWAFNEIIFPDTLKEIGDYAFEGNYGASDMSVYLPPDVVVSDRAFPGSYRDAPEPSRVETLCRSIPRLHVTHIGNDQWRLQSCSEEQERLCVEEAAKWRLISSNHHRHEAWHGVDSESGTVEYEIKPYRFLLEDGRLVGIWEECGSISHAWHGADVQIGVGLLFFDKRNGKDELVFTEYAHSDEFSSESSKYRSLEKADQP